MLCCCAIQHIVCPSFFKNLQLLLNGYQNIVRLHCHFEILIIINYLNSYCFLVYLSNKLLPRHHFTHVMRVLLCFSIWQLSHYYRMHDRCSSLLNHTSSAFYFSNFLLSVIVLSIAKIDLICSMMCCCVDSIARDNLLNCANCTSL